MGDESGADDKGLAEEKPHFEEVEQGPTEKLHDRGEPGSQIPGTEKPQSPVREEQKPNTE
jgi:hypothetical protein